MEINIKKTKLVVQEIGNVKVNIPEEPMYFQNWNGREWIAIIPEYYDPEFIEDMSKETKDNLNVEIPHTIKVISIERSRVIKTSISTHPETLERTYRENMNVKNGKEENFVIEYALNEMIYGNAYSGEVSKERFYEAFNAHMEEFYKDLKI